MVKKLLCLFPLLSTFLMCQQYPDQFYSYQKDSLMARVETLSGMEISQDGKSVILSDGVNDGYVIFKTDSSQFPFNRGLASWNGHVPNDNSSFKVSMRYYNNSWSPWLTIGYWKKNFWTSSSTYGATSFSGGKIDVDYTVLNSYYTKWQFKVEMKRSSSSEPSPSLWKLNFFVSDQKTTDNVNITSIVNDKPSAFFIPTTHYYQYALDPGIGGDICSPTSVSMVLKSFKINVDPLQFAKDNYDVYWGMFGIWPKAVQNAAEYNLNGEVSRYRTWSQAYDTLAAGGRIVMSVGPPLYTGHLMMLAGFDSQGNPLVHDPAKKDGYGKLFNKTDLSESWFNKGGVAYTFFLDSTAITSIDNEKSIQVVKDFKLSVYPNPFNPQTNLKVEIPENNYTEISIFNITGQKIKDLFNGELEQGSYNYSWNASNLPSGMYLIRMISGSYVKTIKALLVK